MATKEQIQRVLSIGITADESAAVRSLSKLAGAIKNVKSPVEDLHRAMQILEADQKAGIITDLEAAKAKAKLTVAIDAYEQRMIKLEKAYMGVIERSKDAIVTEDKLEKQRREQIRTAERLAKAERDRANGLREQQRIINDLATAEANRERRMAELANRRKATAKARSEESRFQSGLDNFDMGPNAEFLSELDRGQIGLQAEADYKENYNKAFGHYVNQQDKLRSGREYMRRFNSDGDTRRDRVSEADDFHRRGAISAEQHGRAVRSINREYSQFQKGLNQVKGVAGTLFGPLTMAVAAGGAIYKTYEVVSEYERNMARMRALTGSAGEALGVAGGIRNISASSPMSFSAGMKAASTYMQYGGDAQTAPGVIRSFAAITGGDSDSMDRLALAYSQVRGAGRLMAQELNQMINAGFNPLMVISEETGESMSALKKRMQEGGISFKEIAQAFVKVTSEGGKFGTMLSEMSGTLSGKVQRMNSEIEKFMIGGAGGSLLSYLATIGSQVATGANLLTGGEDTRGYLQRKSDLYDLIGTTGNGDIDKALAEKANLSRIIDLDKSSPELLSKPERDLLRLYKGQQSAEKDRMWSEMYVTNADKLDQRYAMHDKVVKGGDKLAIAKDYVGMVNELGGSHFNSLEYRNKYHEYLAYIEQQERDGADKSRMDSLFTELSGKRLDKLVPLQYGDNAPLVEMMRELMPGSLSDNKDDTLANLIRKGASYKDLYNRMPDNIKEGVNSAKADLSMSERLKAEKDFAEAIKSRNEEKAKERVAFHADLMNLKSEITYKENIVKLGREEAEILRIMSERKVGRAEAEELRGSQRRLELLSDVPTVSNARAPRSVQAGSQEAYGLMAESMAASEGEQIRLLKEQIRKQQLQVAAVQKTNNILEQMETV